MTVNLDSTAAVIGGGPAGLVAALALAHFGVPTALVAPRPATIDLGASDEARRSPSPRLRGEGRGEGALPQAQTRGESPSPAPFGGDLSPQAGRGGRRSDNRTTALIGSSVAALDALGVWEHCRAKAAPLKTLRIVDDTGRLWRAPEVRFEAAEIDLEAFGWNIQNAHLAEALWERVAATPALVHVPGQASAIRIDEDAVSVTIDDKTLRCRLVVAADGANSICRAGAGIAVERKAYAQTALTFTLAHSRPHHDISTEFHAARGPFTLVPLPGLRSSVVCVVASEEAQHLAALAGTALDEEIERRSHSILGKTRVEPGRGVFAMVVATAQCLAANRIALVGEAAHLFPPIGAQGLNLGLRDAVTIAEIADDVHRTGGDIGEEAATAAYEARRRADVMTRTIAVDLLNRSLLSDLLPVQGLRGLGLYALDRIGPLRRTVMREGTAPRAATPLLMRAATP